MQWKEIEHFDKKWDRRTEKLLKMGKRDRGCQSLLDIGCGLQYAYKWISKHWEIKYYGLDYKKRGEKENLVYDLNLREFPDSDFDVFLCSGCIEYIEDIDWFFDQFIHCKKMALLSYCTMDYNNDIERRINLAWKNNLYHNELCRIMLENGFLLSQNYIFKSTTELFRFDKF